ncbi:hypothetical protein B0H14DRAFT_3502524 [Mycena olivaceomarginata]|nr:hypothetical protein B0H14DRAFT_3502524 [Mycena olivaceomarginata]
MLRCLLPAPPFASGSAASSMSSSPSSASSLLSSESIFDSDSCTAPLMPKKRSDLAHPQKRRGIHSLRLFKVNSPTHCITEHTRVQLTTAGLQYALALERSPTGALQHTVIGRGILRTAAPAPAPAARDFPLRSPTPTSDDYDDNDEPIPATPTPAARGARGGARSILATPQQGSAVALAPPHTVVVPAAHHVMYGICGVQIFYSSYAAAHAAAVSLGLPDSKIMFSETNNIKKLQDWMSGKPFLGDDV